MSSAPTDNISRSTPRTRRRGSADRFIPSSTSRDSLVLGRHPERLTPREKFRRTLSAGPDPFNTNAPRTPIRHRAGSSPPRIGRGIGTRSVRHSSLTSPNGRRMSQGAVWGIGGGAAAQGDSVAGVPDGRGRILASGTNAPLFSSDFLSRRDASAEADGHERRLAMALGLDTASRVFTYSSPPNSPDPGYGSANESPSPPGLRRVWRDNQWMKSITVTCSYGTRNFIRLSADVIQRLQERKNARRPCLLFLSDRFSFNVYATCC
jgi:hypothetical protein